MLNVFYQIIFLIFLVYYRVVCKIIPLFIPTKQRNKNVIFIENFPIENAGYQYRAYKWKKLLERKGMQSEVVTQFESKQDFDNQFPNMPLFYIKTMRKRFRQCLYARKFHTVIVRRELLQFNDYGHLFMEKFLLKIHPNVILDFDDDIAAAKRQPRPITNIYGKLLGEDGNKFNNSLRLYKRFIVGSEYLKQRVLEENKQINEDDVCVIPTCVDYDNYAPKVYEESNHEIVLGWIGGNHNLHYLDMIIEPLNQLSKEYNIKLTIVSGKAYMNDKAEFIIDNRQWSMATEKDLIRSFDIGLMPIENNAVGKGKCGFKLLQYMGLGVVSIATDVTVNGKIIEDGVNGFLVKSDNSNWEEVLKKVLSLQHQYAEISKNATMTVKNKYSFNANIQKYIEWVS